MDGSRARGVVSRQRGDSQASSEKKADAVKSVLDSSDDFEEVLPRRRKGGERELVREKSATSVPMGHKPKCAGKRCESDNTSTRRPVKEANSSSSLLHPCPMCGKTFQANQEAQRGNHMRQCGQLRGMTTEQLLKIKKLEEKQARERKDLGLPPLPVLVHSAENKSARPKKGKETKASNQVRSSTVEHR